MASSTPLLQRLVCRRPFLLATMVGSTIVCIAAVVEGGRRNKQGREERGKKQELGTMDSGEKSPLPAKIVACVRRCPPRLSSTLGKNGA